MYLVFSEKSYCGKILYIGQLKDKHSKIYQGVGIYIESIGNFTMGSWINSFLDGYGRATGKDGKYFEGYCIRDRMYGFGKFVFSNGK